jgi:hypothetical protein
MLDKFWILYDRSPLRVIGAILALVVFLVIGVLCGVARAADATLTWTHPTAFTDGTPLTPAMLANTRIEFGSCAGAAFGTKTGEVNLAPTFLTTTITGLAPGTWCFRAYSKTIAIYGGLESAPTGVVSKVIPFPAPNPPVLSTIVTIAYELRQYSGGTLRFVQVGTVKLGAPCGVPLVGQYAQFTGAKITKPTTGGIIAARCS